MLFDDEVADAKFQGRMMVSCYIELVKSPLKCDRLDGVTTKPKGNRFFFNSFPRVIILLTGNLLTSMGCMVEC